MEWRGRRERGKTEGAGGIRGVGTGLIAGIAEMCTQTRPPARIISGPLPPPSTYPYLLPHPPLATDKLPTHPRSRKPSLITHPCSRAMSTRNVDADADANADANVPAPVGIETTATALSHASERYLPPSELTVKYARGVGGGGGKGEHRIKTLESFYVRPRWLFVRVRCVSGRLGSGRIGCAGPQRAFRVLGSSTGSWSRAAPTPCRDQGQGWSGV